MNAVRATRLVEAHGDIPRRAAAVVYRRVKGHVEYDELVALGNVGLVEAAARFDPDRATSFATFAWYRVHGAIIDGVRKLTSLPVRTWKRLLAMRVANQYLASCARVPGAHSIAGEEALAYLGKAIGAVRTMYMVSLESANDVATNETTDGPLVERQVSHRLSDAVQSLPETERALMIKLYWEGKQLTIAGMELGISKSWSSRLHARAIDRLRGVLEPEVRAAS